MSDATQVRAGITGALYTADVGTTKPTNTTAGWPAGWTDLGLLDEEGSPSMQPTMGSTDFKAWQEFFPVRTVVTERGLEWTFTLIQKSGTNLQLAFGGGTITPLGNDEFRYTPPEPSFIDERAFGLEVVDGSIIDRFMLERGIVANVGAIAFRKDQPVRFELTVRALSDPEGDDAWELVSNDTAMAS